MNVVASGRTWEVASSPAALRLTRTYEEAWQQARRGGRRLEAAEYLTGLAGEGDFSGVRLAILRADLSLRWEAGERIGARWYLDRFPDLGEDTLVALVYEEFCLREDGGESPDAAEFLARYPALAEPLRRVLDIHQLIGSATTSQSAILSVASGSRTASPIGPGSGSHIAFPEAGQTIGGFTLVSELGRGAFARVFLARERQLADRPVALKVTRKGSREPQALARLQHTHIVPVYSHQVDRVTGLHLLCMPYLGGITLSRVLAELDRDDEGLSGASLVEVLERHDPLKEDAATATRSACRSELARRSYAQAIAWWGARLAEALDHAHERGILHRDIKPSNVLVIEDGMPMLLDFNLARESVLDDRDAGEATLGGTVDYMAPEHLEALAAGSSERVDRRSDIYGLGVLLFEAVVGRKPFQPPAKGRSVVDALQRLADERRADPSRLFVDAVDLPAPLRAVIRRCLEPDPQHRYQSAGQVADDLRAVADDLPLLHAREPVLSQLVRGLRRNRRRLAVAALVLVASAAVLGAYLNVQFERHDRFHEVQGLLREGAAAIDRGEFKSAGSLLDNALARASLPRRTPARSLLRFETFASFPAKLRKKLELLWMDPGLEDLEGQIQLKANVAKLMDTIREDADELLTRSVDLRFRLIGLGSDLPGAVAELKQRLRPFYVLNSKQDWSELQFIWGHLDKERAGRLRHEVDELLFLWMADVEGSLRSPEAGPGRNPAAVNAALQVCDRALTFAEARGPWISVRTLLQRHADGGPPGPAPPVSGRLPGEPEQVEHEGSPTACFQWGLLSASRGDRARAMEWLQQAVWLDWSNYWYQFYLGYLKDRSGMVDDALDHYSAAVVQLPESPWLRFNRARLYRTKGRWSWALGDFEKARKLMDGAPESHQVGLEIGLLHQSLGNFARAADEYRALIAAAPGSEYARAARLNLANIDAESGREADALAAYESLLAERPGDSSARFSRALLNLRLRHPEAALGDLDRLIRDRAEISRSSPGEVQTTRALANLLAGRKGEAVADASEAMQRWPSAAGERLLQRALLASKRFEELRLERPDELSLLPLGGAWLLADLRAAAAALIPSADASGPDRYRALLNRSVILSFLGRHAEALRAGDEALTLSPLSPQLRLVRARVRYHAADTSGALAEVEEGLRLQPHAPGLLEVRGVIRAAEGKTEAGLQDLETAVAQAPNAFVHAAMARILGRDGEHDRAAYQWTLALRQDPAQPRAYLGRADSYVALRIWDRALADLEQAATWAGEDLGLQSEILRTYRRCLPDHPELEGRYRMLAERTANQAWERFRGILQGEPGSGGGA